MWCFPEERAYLNGLRFIRQGEFHEITVAVSARISYCYGLIFFLFYDGIFALVLVAWTANFLVRWELWEFLTEVMK